jgi:hypothetical protein
VNPHFSLNLIRREGNLRCRCAHSRFRNLLYLGLAAFLLLSLSATSAPEIESEAQAALLFRLDQRSDFSFSARLTLPSVPTNKGQYCIWIMVGEYKKTSERPAMIQSGLLWWKPLFNFVQQAFVGAEHSGGTMQTLLPLPPLKESSNEHEFRIARMRNEITVEMDSHRIFAAPWYSYFNNTQNIYLRIAAETLTGGDAVSGSVREIELTAPEKQISPYAPAFADEDRGVVFTCKDDAFVATGTFDSRRLAYPRWFRAPSCEER